MTQVPRFLRNLSQMDFQHCSSVIAEETVTEGLHD